MLNIYYKSSDHKAIHEKMIDAVQTTDVYFMTGTYILSAFEDFSLLNYMSINMILWTEMMDKEILSGSQYRMLNFAYTLFSGRDNEPVSVSDLFSSLDSNNALVCMQALQMKYRISGVSING